MAEKPKIEDVRRQFNAPDLSATSPEVVAYIEKLETNIIALAQLREELYVALEQRTEQLALMKMRGAG